jgi:phospholipid-binding lipoprotein MlaA
LVLTSGTDPVLQHKPVWQRNTMTVLAATKCRSARCELYPGEAALDKYVFQRDAHLQRRRN